MAKGRVVIDVWKDHGADPFFWILLQGVQDPYKVYYGREGWKVEPERRETRAKYVTDDLIVDTARVVSSIEISGPMDEILKLIEFAGYHGLTARVKPNHLLAPRKCLTEMSQHLATLPLLQELNRNNRENKMEFSSRQWPLDRPTRYDKGAYKGEWDVITGRHQVVNIDPLPTERIGSSSLNQLVTL